MNKVKLRQFYLFLIDILLYVISYSAIVVIVYPVRRFFGVIYNYSGIIVMTAFLYTVFMVIFKVYFIDWVVASVKDYACLVFSCLISAVFSVFANLFISNDVYFKFGIAANVIIVALVCGVRFFIRLVYKLFLYYHSRRSRRVLVIGAGRLAIMLVRDIYGNEHLDYNVVGLIDDNPEKLNNRIHGAKVLGNRNDIQRVCDEYDIEEIIFAIYDIDAEQKREILDICSTTGRKVKILPSIDAVLSGDMVRNVRELDIEDLLERDPVKLDNELISGDICGKTVLVTGGGGSIGSELCRQIIKYNPKKLVIFDIYENTTYELQNELEESYPEQDIDVLIGSVRDAARLERLFDDYRPDIVFHAAAHKHVPLMEYSPSEAIKNNVFGTYNAAVCAEKYGVRRFVLISTDKAVNPTNVMGASKRICEMIVQTMQKEGKTDFVAVRFGNVLGSNGSMIPRFKKQIAAGGPVTVTHPEITRFFMTIPEAAQLILQAAAYANGGQIYVLDMGEPVKIYDLARKMINLSGFKPDVDIKIKIIGLRPGEKLYEELLMNEEGLQKTAHSKIFVGSPIDITYEELNKKLDMLRGVLDDDVDKIMDVMAEVVPTYTPCRTYK